MQIAQCITPLTRRQFLLATASVAFCRADETEAVIDIHQHTDYSGRTDEQLIVHQRKMGVTHTVLLPAGRFFGLEAMCSGNDRVMEVSRRLPKEYSFFANEVPYLSDARTELERTLKAGGKGIGEQKFMVDADSRAVAMVAEIAQEFGVPVLLHFQFGRYNTSYEKFPRILEKFPKVNFIGHAQTFWANIDAKAEQPVLYPKGPVIGRPHGQVSRGLSEFFRRHERGIGAECAAARRGARAWFHRTARRQVDVWQRLQRRGRGRREVQRSADARSNPTAFAGQRHRAEAAFWKREASDEVGLTLSSG